LNAVSDQRSNAEPCRNIVLLSSYVFTLKLENKLIKTLFLISRFFVFFVDSQTELGSEGHI